ncbi:MAG TPA: helix-turn-helix domain-containing protein [Actinomycetota bacterium]|jgi:cytoskeletal protein RodZ
MAGPLQDATIGVGPALRKAREHRGLTLDEAARDTKLRVDLLSALEDESFDALLGDVYVRGALRAYAQYLGLSPDKVVAAYARHADDPEPPPPPQKMGRIEQAMAAARIRDNQKFLLIAAAALLVILLAVGLLARDNGTPPPAAIPTTAASPPPEDRRIEAILVAQRDASATVTVDGIPETFAMAEGETRSFSAVDDLTITIADGGSVQVFLAGRDLGAPGEPGQSWTKTYTYDTGASPSPGA